MPINIPLHLHQSDFERVQPILNSLRAEAEGKATACGWTEFTAVSFADGMDFCT